MKKPKCHNCVFAGKPFKVGNITHIHCQHPKYNEAKENGTLSAWETLYMFSWICNDHQFKPEIEILHISQAKTDFECPQCQCKHVESDYIKKLSKNKDWWAVIPCKQCKTKLDVFPDIKGNINVTISVPTEKITEQFFTESCENWKLEADMLIENLKKTNCNSQNFL